MEAPRAYLEEWMRKYYFFAECDIGSSGVQNWSFRAVREIAGIEWSELDGMVFNDSETLGGPDLRKALARRFTGGDVDRVLCAHGSSEANYLAMRALLEPGDEVVVPSPRYPQLGTVAEMTGCKIVSWQLRLEDGFAPRLDELRKVVGKRTRMIVVNFPHNPTGATMTREEQAELIALCAELGAYLVWDGAFTPLVYDAEPLPDPISVYPRTISLGTLSKAYGLPGMRIGWCFAAPDVLERMVRLRDHTTLHLSPFIERLAQGVIDHADKFIEPRLAQARHNRDVVAAWVEASGGEVTWTKPAGGVCAAVAFAGIAETDDFCRRLVERHRTLTVPGSCFGDSRWIRLGFGARTAELEEGLRRVMVALAETERS